MLDELRKTDLISHIRRQSEILRGYENLYDLAHDPKEKERARQEIAAVRLSIENYVRELQQTGGELPADITRLMPAQPRVTRILFLAASPAGETPLRVDQEMRDVDEKLRLAQKRDDFELRMLPAVRPEDLTQALLDYAPDIVHFSGHGSECGALYFEDPSGSSHPIQPSALGALFKLVADKVSCVLLNACYSEAQAREIVRYVSYVIGMNTEIGDAAAIAFAAGFYQALGSGRPVEQAYQFAVVQLQLQNIPEHLTPVLLKKT